MKHHAQVGLLLVAFLCIGLNEQAVAQSEIPTAAEIDLWQRAVLSGDAEDFREFLQRYPDSEFSAEARKFLLAVSPSQPNTETSPDEQLGSTRQGPGQDGVLVFEMALASDVNSDNPRSLEQLIEGTPLFAPVEGLPVEYWENEVCSNCHSWDKPSLCAQGEFYLKQEDDASQRIQHPYGGFFKKAVEAWAAGGCQ